MTRVEDSSTVTEDEERSPPSQIRKAIPVIPASSSDSSDSDSDSDSSDSDSGPALPMTRVERTLSVISEVSTFFKNTYTYMINDNI